MPQAVSFGLAYNTFMPRVAVTAIVQLFAPGWTIKTPTVRHNRAKRNTVHVVVTTLLLGSGLAVATNVDDMGATFEVVGAISGVSIALLLPSLCYINLPSSPMVVAAATTMGGTSASTGKHTWTYIGSVAVAVIGAVSMVSVLWSVFDS